LDPPFHKFVPQIDEVKQCIVVRADLKLSKGKTAVQVAHASILSYEKAERKIKEKWKKEGQKKVVLQVESEKELLELKKRCEDLGIPCALVVDAGLTEIPPGTVTALGIGPDLSEKIDKVTGNLRLL